LVAAGVPANLQYVNSQLPSGVFTLGNSQNSWYDAAVVELRRRLSHGLRVQASYTFSKALTDFFGVSAIVNVTPPTLRDGYKTLNKTVQPFDVRHVFKLDSTYDLPFGRGREFAGGAGTWLNELIGDWSILPVVTWQSGAPIQIGNAQLVGMTVKDLQKAVKVRKESSKVYWLPDDIIQNSQRAFDTSATSATGYGSTFGGAPTGRFIAPQGYGNCQAQVNGTCGFQNLVIYGPSFFNLDVGINKRWGIGEKHSLSLKVNILNALNHPNFRVGGFAGDTTGSGCCGATFGELGAGSAYRDTNTTNNPGGRVMDFVMRFNW